MDRKNGKFQDDFRTGLSLSDYTDSCHFSGSAFRIRELTKCSGEKYKFSNRCTVNLLSGGLPTTCSTTAHRDGSHIMLLNAISGCYTACHWNLRFAATLPLVLLPIHPKLFKVPKSSFDNLPQK